jgi:hypothetical protein
MEDNELFNEDKINELVDWGGLVHNEHGEYYIDKNLSPDILCFEKWYLTFPTNLVWVPKLLTSKALVSCNQYMLAGDNTDIKKIIIKEIVFEYTLLKASGELDAFLASLN